MSKATPSTDAALDPAHRGRGRAAPRLRLRACAIGIVASLGALSSACVEATPVPAVEVAPPPANGPPVAFSFETTDGATFRDADVRGRFTVIAFAATYDITSQAQLKVLSMVQRDRRPRVNVAAIVLEPPENKPLVIAFAQSLDLRYPVALADERTVAGHGPFEGLHSVPAIVLLDREGREVHRHIGAYDQKQLEAALDAAGAR